MNQTIQYYNKNADAFYNSTVNADMGNLYQAFLTHINIGEKILDFGCSSGRDSKYFLEHGYQVTSIDGSEELCKKASQLTGQEVLCLNFKDIKFENELHGIWACASILHLPEDELCHMIGKMNTALKRGGVIYVSFKYGDFSGERNGRYFTNMTEEKLVKIISAIDGLEIVETFITGDVRDNRHSEQWLNAIMKKR